MRHLNFAKRTLVYWFWWHWSSTTNTSNSPCSVVIAEAFVPPFSIQTKLLWKRNIAQSPFYYSTGDTSQEAKENIPAVDLDQLSRTRPYGFFIAEKAAELLDRPGCRLVGSQQAKLDRKEKIVVLGTGWGATSFLKAVDTDAYDVTVVSPRNYFLFTPMLAGASVGTVEYRSITEPVREINRRVKYLEGTAVYIDPQEQTVVVKPVECDGNNAAFCGIEDHDEIPYDRLIYAIGAQTNTFGIPGVQEHCNFLKQVGDARKIRAAVVNCFERASFPDVSDAEKKKLLTFAVIGAGPSGIEFAAELRDFIEEEGPKYYPDLLRHVQIKIIEGSNTVLAPFHKSLQQAAMDKMNLPGSVNDSNAGELPSRFNFTSLMLESFVNEVSEDCIHLTDGTEIPYGLSVWAAGNAPLPLTLDLIEQLGSQQHHQQGVARGRIAADPWLRALGGDGRIFAIGDASCVVHNQVPATGQAASQEGEYIAQLLNKRYDVSRAVAGQEGTLHPPVRIPSVTKKSMSESIASVSTKTSDYAKPFQFLDLGILAYTGSDTALAQVSTTPNLAPVTLSGKLENQLWKAVYLWKQVSWRNRLMILSDWFKHQLFGRDVTHLE